jgi:hypothetical protein
MRTIPFAAFMVLACNTPQPTESSDPPVSVGTSAEELRLLGQRDSDDVEQCRAAAAKCSAGADSGVSTVCERIEQHCDALEEQLEQDRAELAQCLEEAALCEQNATDPAECEDARAACAPVDDDFRARRGRTRECATRAEQCLDRGDRFGGRGDADAGAPSCDADASDFVRCCRGNHGADAGPDGDVRNRFGRGGRDGFGFRPRPDGNGFGDDDADADDPDAGAPPPRRRF